MPLIAAPSAKMWRSFLAFRRRHSPEPSLAVSSPFGFRRVADRLVLDPVQQRALEKARSMRSSGVSLRRIAAELEAMEVFPNGGAARWHPQTVKTFLIRRMTLSGRRAILRGRSIDLMHDRLATGRTIRTMNVVDDCTRECLAIEVAFSFGSHDVIRCFEAIADDRTFPQAIRFDNGPEFTSRAVLQWAATKSIDLQFIQPGKPTQNAQIKSLNGRVRDELLNAHTFLDIQDARQQTESWRQDYNETRPHSSLGYRTPKEFARVFSIIPPSQL
jgi:transposase InsO family protein